MACASPSSDCAAASYDHIKTYQKIPGVEIATICDVDENVMAARLTDIAALGMPKPATFTDYRKLLDTSLSMPSPSPHPTTGMR